MRSANFKRFYSFVSIPCITPDSPRGGRRCQQARPTRRFESGIGIKCLIAIDAAMISDRFFDVAFCIQPIPSFGSVRKECVHFGMHGEHGCGVGHNAVSLKGSHGGLRALRVFDKSAQFGLVGRFKCSDRAHCNREARLSPPRSIRRTSPARQMADRHKAFRSGNACAEHQCRSR